MSFEEIYLFEQNIEFKSTAAQVPTEEVVLLSTHDLTRKVQPRKSNVIAGRMRGKLEPDRQ